MRRQSLFMLVGSAFLALIAVFIARVALNAKTLPAAPTTFPVVAASKPLAFGDKITPDALTLVGLPLGAVPQGAFRKIDTVVGDGTRVAQRAIAVNEVIVPTAISGTGNRLSTMGVIGDNMRALTVNVTESSGVGGLVAPGDHVDVFITRTPPDNASRVEVVGSAAVPMPDDISHRPTASPSTVRHGPLAGDGLSPASRSLPRLLPQTRSVSTDGIKPTPMTDLLIQDVRVLAIGQNSNVSSEKPELVRSATLEVTPAQVAKLTLGQTVGTLALALRPLSDKDHTVVPSLHVDDLHDGPIGVAPPVRAIVAHAHLRAHRVGMPPAEPQVEIVRSGEATHYTVPRS